MKTICFLDVFTRLPYSLQILNSFVLSIRGLKGIFLKSVIKYFHALQCLTLDNFTIPVTTFPILHPSRLKPIRLIQIRSRICKQLNVRRLLLVRNSRVIIPAVTFCALRAPALVK